MSTVCVGHNLEAQKFVHLLLSMGCILKMSLFIILHYLASLLTNKVQVLQEQQEKASVQQ